MRFVRHSAFNGFLAELGGVRSNSLHFRRHHPRLPRQQRPIRLHRPLLQVRKHRRRFNPLLGRLHPRQRQVRRLKVLRHQQQPILPRASCASTATCWSLFALSARNSS